MSLCCRDKPSLRGKNGSWTLTWYFAHHKQQAHYPADQWDRALARANWLAYHQGFRTRRTQHA